MSGRPFTDDEVALLHRWAADGVPLAEQARRLRRSEYSVQNKINRERIGPAQRKRETPPPPAPVATAPLAAPGEPLTIAGDPEHTTLDSGRTGRITSLDQLLAAACVDQHTWVVDRHIVNKWEVGTKHPETGAVLVEPLWQVKAWLSRKQGLSVEEQTRAMIDGALAARQPRARGPIRPHRASDLLQVVVIADPHFAKYAHGRATGHGDYDLSIARRELLTGARFLLDAGRLRGVRERVIVSLGDYFHYDTPAGTTTGGTALDRDSRAEKMIEVGTQTLTEIIAESAETAQTRVIAVPGNHDAMLTISLRLILRAEFKGNPNVTVVDGVSKRQYLPWGANLLGFDHGDKNKKLLAANMAVERPREWGGSVYREIHTGHLHQEQERYEGTLTHAGVIVRTHRSIAPADAYHADEGFVGAPRGMSAWVYHRAGGLVATDVADPRLLALPEAA